MICALYLCTCLVLLPTVDEFPALTEEEEAIVSKALVPRPPQQMLTEGFKLQLTRADFATLGGLNWLNDEVSCH